MEHEFTESIRRILYNHFGQDADEILSRSDLIQYLNHKTRSASRGSKSRGAFANIYAIFVLVEDCLKRDFDLNDDYSDYEGAQFSQLLLRQRELPFGSKLQNHALNNRLNDEFRMKPLGRFFQVTETTEFGKYFLDIDKVINYPITFVIKTEQPASELTVAIRSKAEEIYPVRAIVDRTMAAVEELINIPRLVHILNELSADGRIVDVVDEILLYSKVEFDYSIQN